MARGGSATFTCAVPRIGLAALGTREETASSHSVRCRLSRSASSAAPRGQILAPAENVREPVHRTSQQNQDWAWSISPPRRPLLRTMQNSQHLDLIAHFVYRDERQRSEHELASAFDTAKPSAIRKRMKRCDAFDDCLGYAARGIGACLGDVITDPFEVIGSVRGPADAHQPR